MYHIVFLLIGLGLSLADVEEPRCSKYEFEEKVLEKMVRMEFQMEKWKSEISELFTKVLDLKESYVSASDDVERMKSAVEGRVSSIEQRTSQIQQEMNHQLQAVTAEIKTPSVSFRAKLTGYVSLTTGQTITFPVVMLNEGQGYDPSTGIFTAPVNGTYIFGVTLCPFNGKSITYNIIVDGTVKNRVHANGDADHGCFSSLTNLILVASQRVAVQVAFLSSGSGNHIDAHKNYRWVNFSGTLIHA